MLNKIYPLLLGLFFYNIAHADNNWLKVDTKSAHLKCADGTPYNFYYKKGNNNLLIFFNGGGACWDFNSCSSIDKNVYPLNTYEESANLPYNKPDYWKGLLNLENDLNPVKDWSILNLPYCTADLFIGKKSHIYRKDGKQIKIFHYGNNNVAYAINWLKLHDKRLFKKVLIAGSSSGGYGAIFNSDLINKRIRSENKFVFFDASDGVVTRDFEKKVFSQNSVWGYKPTLSYNRNYIINKYNNIISNNKNVIYGSFSTSNDIMQILFFHIMGNHYKNWINISDKSIKDWKKTFSENQILLLKNKNYSTYIQDECIHSGLRYNDSFYNKDKIPFYLWLNDFLNKNNYSKGTEFLFRKSQFNEKERSICITRAISSVERHGYEK